MVIERRTKAGIFRSDVQDCVCPRPRWLIPSRGVLRSTANSRSGKLVKLFRILGDHGKHSNPEKFGDLGDGLYEFKSFQVRMPLPMQRTRRGLVLISHGFMEEKDKTPKAEIAASEDDPSVKTPSIQSMLCNHRSEIEEKAAMTTKHDELMLDPEFRKLYAIEGLHCRHRAADMGFDGAQESEAGGSCSAAEQDACIRVAALEWESKHDCPYACRGRVCAWRNRQDQLRRMKANPPAKLWTSPKCRLSASKCPRVSLSPTFTGRDPKSFNQRPATPIFVQG
jgi:hypothetical protein